MYVFDCVGRGSQKAWAMEPRSGSVLLPLSRNETRRWSISIENMRADLRRCISAAEWSKYTPHRHILQVREFRRAKISPPRAISCFPGRGRADSDIAEPILLRPQFSHK